jgi:hypothetical protein
MVKIVKKNLVEYSFVESHKYAHYTVNGETFMNCGDFLEIALKAVLGLKPVKDGNGKFSEGSDIEEYKMSVKSGKATLTSVELGDTKEEILNNYFAQTASTSWAWVTMIDENIIAYIMNKAEFTEFTKNWTSPVYDKKLRYKSTSPAMLEWLNKRV